MKDTDNKDLYYINDLIVRFCKSKLWSSAEKRGMEFLRERGLTDEIIDKFDLGYTGEDGEELSSYLETIGISGKDFDDAGIWVWQTNSDYAEYFKDRVVFPYKDTNGRVIGSGLRAIGSQQPIYRNSAWSAIFDCTLNLFGIDQAQHTKSDFYIICAGFMDALMLHQAGYDMTVGLPGIGCPAEVPYIGDVKKIYLAYDTDCTGVVISEDLSDVLVAEGVEVWNIDVRPYLDPAELISRAGGEEFEKRFLSAKRIG